MDFFFQLLLDGVEPVGLFHFREGVAVEAWSPVIGVHLAVGYAADSWAAWLL